MTEAEISFPFGNADVQALAYAAVQNVEIKNHMTILEFAILTGDTTLNITLRQGIKDGARLLIKVPATNAADDITFGAGIDAPNLIGVAGKTKTQAFTLRNGVFYPDGAAVQID
jgi:hypothetical protein